MFLVCHQWDAIDGMEFQDHLGVLLLEVMLMMKILLLEHVEVDLLDCCCYCCWAWLQAESCLSHIHHPNVG